MTRYLIDTNIVSDAIKPSPSKTLLAWMAEREDTELFISSVSIAEIRRGILDLSRGRKRASLETWFDGPNGLRALFAGRILPFDENAALVWARLMADGRAKGRPRNAFDTLIAAIAETNGCLLVTDNTRDFPGVKTINPLRAAI